MPVAGNPIILYSGGIPISPSDLDFGNSVTQAQLNALSSFSQMVNAIPAPGNVWVSTGSETWSIYKLVLTMAEFAQAAQAPPPPQPQFATRSVDVTGSKTTIEVPDPLPAVMSAAPSVLSALGETIAPALNNIGFQLGETNQPSPTNSNQNGAKPSKLPPLGSSGLASMFLQLEAQLAIDALTDTLGSIFYPTYLFPADFYQPQYDASWQPFTITPGEDDPWIPINQGDTVSGEIITLPLQRAWWITWVFNNRGWRFDPSTGFGNLSDGGSPPQGMMPMYASALIIARNIQVSPAQSDSFAPLPANLNPFVLKTAENNSAEKDSAANSLSNATDPTAMLIVGFVCTPLPLCPNPDPTLNWGS